MAYNDKIYTASNNKNITITKRQLQATIIAQLDLAGVPYKKDSNRLSTRSRIELSKKMNLGLVFPIVKGVK